MNALVAFGWPLSGGSVEQLGWILVHSLWQFALVALLAGSAQRAMRQTSALARYAMLIAAMTVMIVGPVATWMCLPSDVSDPLASRSASALGQDSNDATSPEVDAARLANNSIAAGDAEIETPTPDVAASSVASERPPATSSYSTNNTQVTLSWSVRAESVLRPWLAWIVVGWSIGVAVCSLRPLLGWHTLRRLKQVGISSASDDVLAAMIRVSKQLDLHRAVRVLQSTLAQVPIVVGYVKPVILLPISLVTSIPAAQLEAILAHELAHVRRHDFVVNLLQTLVETLFFYHPAVWWLSRQIRVEREHCCDDLVVASLGNRVEYGRALLAIEELRGQSAVLALGATNGSLLSRVRRIVGFDADVAAARLSDRWPVAFVGLVTIGLVLTMAFGSFVASRAEVEQSRIESIAPNNNANPENETRFPPPKPDDVRGLDLSKVAVRSHEAAYRSLPDLYGPYSEKPWSGSYAKSVFLMPLAEHTWLYYPAGSGHFYIQHRHDGTPESEQIYGPIEGDPFEVLKLEELLREQMKPGATSGDPRYRLRLMFRNGEPGLVRRAWRMIEPELAFKSTPRDENFYRRFELFEGVRDALRDRPEVFRNPELKDVLAQAQKRVETAEAEFDELNGFGDDAGADDGYESVTYLQPKIAAKIPESLWGKPLDGLRLALVPREWTPGTDWNELPLDTLLPTSITVKSGQEQSYQLVVENVSDHDIKLCGHVLGEERHRTLEVLDRNGKRAETQGLHTTIPSFPSYWRLKPGERHLLSMPAVHFMPAQSNDPNQGLGYFVKTAPGEYTLRCSYVFGLYDNTRHRHVPDKGVWVGQLTTGSQKITVAAPDDAQPEAAQAAAKPVPAASKVGAAANPDAGGVPSQEEAKQQIAELDQKVTALRAEIAEKSKTLGQKHPTIESLQRQIHNAWLAKVKLAPFAGPQLAKLPDAAYTKCGSHYQGLGEQHPKSLDGVLMGPLTWSNRQEGPLQIGMRVAKDAQWQIGSSVTVQLWVRNLSKTDVRFSRSHRSDNGLSVWATDKDGKEYGADIAPFDQFLVFEHLMLPAFHGVMVKEFLVRFDAEKRDVSEPSIAAFHLAPGKYSLRCKWSDAREMVAHEGEWTGELTSDERKFSLVANDMALGDGENASDRLPPKSLEFLKPYPKLHGLSLDMTEKQFLEIVKQQELKTRRTIAGEKVTHHIGLGDGHTLIVMFDKVGKCSGIQRVRGEDEKDSGGPPELRVLRKPALLLPDHWIMQAVGFDRDGKELVTASYQSGITIRRWDVVGRKLISEIKLQADTHGRQFREGTLMFSGDRRRVIAATDAYVGIWETATGKLLQQLPFKTKEGIYDCAIDKLDCTPDLSVIVGHRALPGRLTLSYDAHLIVWDGASGNVLRTVIDKGATDLKAIDLSMDGKLLVTTNGGGAKIWETSTGQLLRSIPNDNTGSSHVRQNVGDSAESPRSGERGYESHVWSVQFSPDGKLLAMGDILGVKLLDATSGKLLQQLEGPYRYSSGAGPGLVFSKDGQWLARLGTQDKTAGDHHGYVVPIWSTRTGAKLFELHTEANDAAFSDDGERLAVVFSDMQQALSVWSLSGDAADSEKTDGPGPHSRQDRVEENGHYQGQKAAEFIDAMKPVWSDTQLGIQYGIALTKPAKTFRSGERVPLVFFFRNTSDKPLKLDMRPDYYGNTPRVLNAQGEAIELQNIPLLGSIAHYVENLQPGEAVGPFYANFGLGENPRPGQQHWHPFVKTPAPGKYSLTHTVSINVSGPNKDDASKQDRITTRPIEFEIVDQTAAKATSDASGVSLSDAVASFNAENKQLGIGLDQPLLTEDEVVAAIKRGNWKDEVQPLNEQEIASFKALAESRRLPKEFFIQAWTEQPSETFIVRRYWQIQLSLPAVGHDGFVPYTIRNTKFADEKIDPKAVAWGKPDADGLSLGTYLSPKKDKYQIGERVHLRLFVRNDGQKAVPVTWPNTSHPMPEVTDEKGAKVAVRIGHKQFELDWISGFIGGSEFAPGGTHAFTVPFEISIGGEGNKLIGRVIEARPGQTLKLKVRGPNGNNRIPADNEPTPESGVVTFKVKAEKRESPGSTPTRESQNPKDGAKPNPATEQKLEWGEPVNGLRMALAWPPTLGEESLGETADFFLAVQNPSKAPVRLSVTDASPHERCLDLKDKDGILFRRSSKEPNGVDVTLQPQVAVFLRLFPEAAKDPSAATGGAGIASSVRQSPDYRLKAALKVDKAPAGAWSGTLVTPDTRAGVGAEAPKNRKAQELFKVWLNPGAPGLSGKIPGGFIEHLGEHVKAFVKGNAADAAGAPVAKRMEPLLSRLDGTRDWQPVEAATLLNDIAAVSDSPLIVMLEEIAGGKVQHGLPFQSELEKAPWGEPVGHGLGLSRRAGTDWAGNRVEAAIRGLDR